jgi:hypothetical protein
VILGGSDRDRRFADGAQDVAERTALGTVPTLSIAVGDLAATTRLLRDHGGVRLVGIMDDAAYAIFHESARSAGARLLCLGRHAGGVPSRHALLTTPPVAGTGTRLAEALGVAGCAALVTESPLGTVERGAAVVTPDDRGRGGAAAYRTTLDRGAFGDWTETLAHVLVGIALGAEPTADRGRASRVRREHAPERGDAGARVTFVIDV